MLTLRSQEHERQMLCDEDVSEVLKMAQYTTCQKCLWTYNGKYARGQHDEDWHELGGFKCDICQKGFQTKYHTKLHEKVRFCN